MKHFYIIPNQNKDIDGRLSREIAEFLKSRNATCVIRKTELQGGQGYTDANDIPADTECIIVIGGDGTMLAAARDIALKDLPLLGINMGNLGYLAEVDSKKVKEALECCLEDRFSIEERMMLAGQVRKADGTLYEDRALNDIVVARTGDLRIVLYDICVDGKLLKKYEADGMIFSTPTGSTGYSMSAGGPIVAPDAKLMVLTPICPHTLNTRSIVLGPDSVIEINMAPGRDGSLPSAGVTFDGRNGTPLTAGDSILIRKSDRTTKILKLSNDSFLEVLKRKMSDH